MFYFLVVSIMLPMMTTSAATANKGFNWFRIVLDVGVVPFVNVESFNRFVTNGTMIPIVKITVIKIPMKAPM